MGFFKAYDMRGTFGVDFDLGLVRRIGRALPRVVKGRRWLVGRDCRVTGGDVSAALVGVANAMPDEADCGYEGDYEADTRTLTLTLDVKPGEGATLRWHTYPTCPALDRAAMVHALLLPVRMGNADKDRMLQIAQTVCRSEKRLAAWMTLDLPAGLMGALAELEYVE